MPKNYPASRHNTRVSRMMSLLLPISILIGCSKSNHSSPASPLNDMDHKFLTDASFSNYDEIDASKLTSSQSSNGEVKTLGQEMINDYRTSESELGNIADSLKVPIPAEPDSAHKLKINKLMALSGAAFDTTYLRDMINDHQGAISLFQKELNTGQSARLQQFVNKYLPRIQRHLTIADSIMGVLQQH